ncbi:MAG: hypothetical protein ACC742_05655 [Thermoanaerobaculales bacterium]
MSKVFSSKPSWTFVLMMIAPVVMIMAEDPSSTRGQPIREDQPAVAAGGDVAPGAEFRLFERLPPQPPSAEGPAKAAAYGIVSTAATAGAKFTCVGASGVAYLGFGDWGIDARGDTGGAHFEDTNESGNAYVANGNAGILAYGNTVGGYFKDLDGAGYAYAGYGDTGVQGIGATGISGSGTTVGGYFEDSSGSGYANVGNGDYGIRSYGNTAGGYFEDSNGSGYANLGEGDYGIRGYGTAAGGYFKDSDGSGYSNVGSGDFGIRSYGFLAGGYFQDTNGSGYANVGIGDYGIKSYGNTAGGYFSDRDGSGIAFVGYGDSGITALGDTTGGYFQDTNSSTWARVANSSYKILGSGSVNFVQNHPYDRDAVIVYTAPEGDEVATYTRGTARLLDGEARIALGKTFRWVTNPDIGLTTYLTPVGEWSDLYVAERTTEELVVRSAGGARNGTFDYMVYGLRIGFEESSIVQEKQQEAYIPSMAEHRQLYERRPELKSYSSLERFKGMRRAAGQKEEVDLSRAHALRDAIVEFDPAVHELPGAGERPEPGERVGPVRSEDAETAGVAEPVPGERERGVGPDVRAARIDGVAASMDAEGNVYATSFRPSSQDLASLLDVSEAVEAGDVMVIDRAGSGKMRRAFEASDTGVIGVVTASPGVVLGMASPSSLPGERPADGSAGEAANNEEAAAGPVLRAPVAFSGVVRCKVDADFGAIWPGDLLVTSPNPGHAMRNEAPLPGTVLGKALEALDEGAGTIRVLVMLR